MRTTFITVNMKKWGIDATVVITFIHLAGLKVWIGKFRN